MCITYLSIFLWTDSYEISTLQETSSYSIVGVFRWLPGLRALCGRNAPLKRFRCWQITLKNAGTTHTTPQHCMRLPLSPHSQSMINLQNISCCAFPGLHNPGRLAHLFLPTQRPMAACEVFSHRLYLLPLRFAIHSPPGRPTPLSSLPGGAPASVSA